MAYQSSLIYIKTRGLMELFPPRLRNLWKYWELRVLVLLSLILQIILIIFGNRRKYTSKIWIRIGLWCAYLMADWVVTVALGVISNNLGDTAKSIGKDGSPIDNIQLTAFWAPFLLLHLGGPNTITAYSMEDNELWLRHLLRLGVQTGVALYIFLTAWMGSQISILSILIFCAGTIKYGERTWVLRSASNEQFRESMLTPPNIGPNYSKFMREYTLKQFEGFHVIADKVIEAQVVNLPSVENNSIRDATELVIANDLINIFKRLFVDLILGFDDKDYTVIEMELGFMYDMLYTKGTVIHSPQGWCLRLISFSFTSIALTLFSVIHQLKYSTIDLVVTFLLLSIAILLETNLCLSKNATSSIHRAITYVQLPKQPRWSNFMSQFNLLSFSLKDKRTVIYKTRSHHYTTCEKVPNNLKELEFDHLKEKFEHLKENSKDADDIRILCSYRGGAVLEKYSNLRLDCHLGLESVKVQFDQSFLIWHIATDLFYHLGYKTEAPLFTCPFMLPMGLGMIRFRDTCAEVTQFFEEYKSIASYACEILLDVNTQVPPTKVKGDRSKSVLFDACRLASDLQAISD
ncbi:hypothetical protein ACB094_05G012000 [Castanea mollissima]